MNNNEVKVKVWDIPVRVFHWGMLLLLAGLWWSADQGEMSYHQLFAYSLMILLVVRLIWGFIGSDTARFSHFVRHPRQALDYLAKMRAKQAPHSLGHNPLGGYMVVLLLIIISLQLMSGLFATDEIFTEGPLVSYVSGETASWFTWLHKKNFDLLLILAGIHVAAVLLHRFKGEKLVGAMFSGYKRLPAAEAQQPRFASLMLALVLLLVVAVPVVHFLMMPVIGML